MTALRMIAPGDDENNKPAASVMYVDPETAARWLSKNDKNRNIRSSVVNLYARDMSAGNWRFTGEAVKFDRNGKLVDGQHRLMAVIKSGVTLPLLVVRNVPTDAQGVMDSGAKRTAADALSLRGHKNAHSVAAAARLGLTIEAGEGETRQVTHSEIAEYLDANPDLEHVASTASKARAFLDFAPASLVYAWMLLNRSDADASARFFDSLINNSTEGKGDPRNTLLRRMAQARKNGEYIPRVTQVQFIVRAWNAWRNGDELHVLRSKANNNKGASVSVSIPKVR